MSEAAPDLSQIFRDEAAERLDAMDRALLACESGQPGGEVVEELFRHAHTIKGTAGLVGRDDVSSFAHEVEDVLDGIRQRGEFPREVASLLLDAVSALRALVTGSAAPSAELRRRLGEAAGQVRGAPRGASPAAEQPGGPGGAGAAGGAAAAGAAGGPGAAASRVLRVPAAKIDHLLDVVAEVVQFRHRLAHSAESGIGADSPLADDLRAGERMLDELRDTAVAMRMLPVATITGPLPRAVRDMARQAGKEAELVMAGTGTEMDRVVLESLSEPIAHLLRNAVTHGIETPEERQRAGKPRRGRVELRAAPRGSSAEIVVADDGRGVAPEVIQEAGRSGSLVDLLTRPGYSTAGEVTGASGRGVGLNAVRAQVNALGGSMEIRSWPGRGTEVALLLPLALSLLEVLLFERSGAVYGVPQASVQEVVAIREPMHLQGRPMLAVHGHPVPLADIADLLGVRAPRLQENAPALVIRSGDRRVAVSCDVLAGQQEVAVKPLGRFLGGTTGYLGSAVLGDGRIALLLEPKTLATGIGRAPGPRADAPADLPRAEPPPAAGAEAAAPRERPAILVVEDSFTVRELQRSILESAGYPVATARDGQDALEVLRRDPRVGLVVTDVEMPVLDGLSMLRAIRADPDRASLPVVVVTAHASDEERRQGVEAGADAYLAKGSFDQQALLAIVARLLGR